MNAFTLKVTPVSPPEGGSISWTTDLRPEASSEDSGSRPHGEDLQVGRQRRSLGAQKASREEERRGRGAGERGRRSLWLLALMTSCSQPVTTSSPAADAVWFLQRRSHRSHTATVTSISSGGPSLRDLQLDVRRLYQL